MTKFNRVGACLALLAVWVCVSAADGGQGGGGRRGQGNRPNQGGRGGGGRGGGGGGGGAVTPPNQARWFPWTAVPDIANESVIDASGLLEAPAGLHGRIVSEGDRLMYNGQPIKIWGLNTCYEGIAPEHAVADRRAAMYAKYGFNAVRLHKFADGHSWDGMLDPGSAVRYNEAKTARMDYYVNALKNKGIYVKLSANFGNVGIGPNDRARVPNAQQLGQVSDGWIRTPHAAMWLMPEVQDLQIEQLTNMLRRVNAASGIRYADDPALFVVELVNENCAFFYNVWGGASNHPILKPLAGRLFREWLHAKYGTEAALLEAWGRNAYNGVPDQGTEGESWNGPIYPAGNPWFWDNVGRQDPRFRRLVDAALFWYDRQNQFYDRFIEAIRATGYEGEILASNWLAGTGYAHFLNLHSDGRVGMIDRHNYHGGTGSMLATPGSSILSSGMKQQMADRPFMLSEWIHETYNSMWGEQRNSFNDFITEGPPIIAAYGMGLNGWDVSFLFQNADDGVFRGQLEHQWDVVAPQVMAVMPAISRMVLRGDVAESELLFTRHVDLPSLMRGELDFRDSETVSHDIKVYDSDKLSSRLMAVGRMVVEFGDEPRATEGADPARYMENGMLVSSTRELRWRPGANSRDGHMVINTLGTQAVIGFTGGARTRLRDAEITIQTPFAAVYATSLDDRDGLDTASRALITAMARVRNTGMQIGAQGQMLAPGQGPMLLEPVEARILFDRPVRAVHVLDQDGRRTGRTLPLRAGALSIDTGRDRTPYYLVEFE